MDNGDVLDPRSRANVNQVTADRSYSEVTGGSVPQDVPLPAVVSNDDNVMKTTYADNELPRRLCSNLLTKLLVCAPCSRISL